MRRTKLVALSTSGVLALSLAACSGSGGPSGNDKSNGSDGGSSSSQKAADLGQDATATGPAAAIAGAKSGGTVYVNDQSNPPTMDPSGIYYTDSGAIASGLLYRTLTQYKVVDGKSVLVPDLATNLGTPSADGLTWKFKVKTGIKYSDGSPVKLADYVYAVKRSFAQDTVAFDGTRYQNEFFKGGDTYKGPFKDKGKAFPGVTTEGSDTLVFHLTKKFPTLNFFTSFSMFSPIPESKDTQANYQRNPLTTGPYKVDSFTKGSKIVMSKNTNWAPKTDPVRHQLPDKIQVNFNTTPATSQSQILNNSGTGASTVDVSAVDSSVASQVTGAKKDQYVSGQSACEYYINMDTRKIPFDIRKVIAVAYPYNQIRKAGQLSSLNYEPATTYAAPSLQGFKKYAPVNGATGTGNGDPAKAKAMLAKLGKTGYQLSYYYRNDQPPRVAANNARVQGLEAAGFKVKAIGISGEEYTKKIQDSKAPVNMLQGTPGWCYDWPTGDSVYPPLFNGAGISSGLTVGQFKNAAINAKMAKIQQLSAQDAAPKWAALDKELMSKYLPALPDYYSASNAIFGTKLKNVVLDPRSSIPVLSDIYVG